MIFQEVMGHGLFDSLHENYLFEKSNEFVDICELIKSQVNLFEGQVEVSASLESEN